MRALARLVGDEGARSVLRGSDAAGRNVGRAHAARDIHRQYDRLVLRGQRDGCGRAARWRPASTMSASRNNSGGTWRRNPCPVPIAARTTARLGIAQQALPSSPQQKQVDADHGRHGEQQPQQIRPQKAHASVRGARAACHRRASWLRRLRRSAKRSIASTRSSSVESSSASTPACRNDARSAFSRCSTIARKAFAEASIVGVDGELFPGLGVLDRHQSEIGQLHLQRIVQAHRDDLVPQRKARERLRPSGCTDEIGHDEHQRSAPHECERSAEQNARDRSRSSAGAPDGQAWYAGCAARGGGRFSPRSRCRRGRRRRSRRRGCHGGSEAARARRPSRRLRRACRTAAGAEIERRAEVEQEPRRQVAILVILAHVRGSAGAPSRSSRCAGRHRDTDTRADRRDRARNRETACGSRRAAGRRDGE